MRIALVGYGRMGHEVERVAARRGHSITAVVDPAASDAPAPLFGALSAETLAECDVAIEFSLPDAVEANVNAYVAAGCPAVVGTTGWYDRLPAIRSRVEKGRPGLVYGSNFSIGAHIFFAAARYAASLVRNLDDYDLMIHEVHHRMKKDSPSGTALTLAHSILDAVPRKKRIETARLDRAPEPDELHVSSSRVGYVPGTHTLTLDSDSDTIEVQHRARSRSGFALGAVLAAEWIVDRSGVYDVETFVRSVLFEEQGEE